MTRRPHQDVESFPDALSWLRTTWTTLPVPPTRLHTRVVDGQLGQRYSSQFARILGGLGGYRAVVVQDTCHHPGLPRSRHGEIEAAPGDCQDCQGSGLHLVTRSLYDHPMYVALGRLGKVARSPGAPAPVDLVLALAWCGWDLTRASRAVGVEHQERRLVEAMFLNGIRGLHSRYDSGPPPTKGRSQLAP